MRDIEGRVTFHEDQQRKEYVINTSMSMHHSLTEYLADHVRKEIAAKIVEKYVEDHYQEIISKIDIEALTKRIVMDLANAVAAESVKTVLEAKKPNGS